MSAALANTMHEITETLINIQASRYTCGAGMTIMLYDFFLTVGDEINFIWSGSQRMSVVKFMFIWNRYMTMPWIIVSNYHLAAIRPAITNTVIVRIISIVFTPVLTSVFSCKVVIPAIAIVQGISIIIGIQLLALRVLALYKNDRKVRFGLYTWLALCHTATFTLAAVSMSRFIPFLMYLPLTNTCYTITDPLVPFVYVPPLLAEGGILLLQVVNHIQRRKADSTFRSTLLNTLFRDGYLYFGLVMTLRLVAVFLYEFGPGSLWFVSNQMDFALSTALISRFFLQLRSAMRTISDDTVLMPLSNKAKPQRSVSFSLPIQSASDLVSADEQYLHIQQLRRLKAPR